MKARTIIELNLATLDSMTKPTSAIIFKKARGDMWVEEHKKQHGENGSLKPIWISESWNKSDRSVVGRDKIDKMVKPSFDLFVLQTHKYDTKFSTLTVCAQISAKTKQQKKWHPQALVAHAPF